jgi:hypothetical protein
MATVIPVEGNIKDPKTSGWQTFVGILRNAFVQASHESLSDERRERDPVRIPSEEWPLSCIPGLKYYPLKLASFSAVVPSRYIRVWDGILSKCGNQEEA